MKSGIRRKVDDLGRVVIPAGIRRSLAIREGDALEVSVQGDEVVLSKPVDQCVFCHSRHELRTFRDKAICASCALGIGMLDTTTKPAGGDPDETTREVPPPAWPTASGAGRAGPADAGAPSGKLDVRAAERGAVAHEGGLRVVRSEAVTPDKRQELPASTTAW